MEVVFNSFFYILFLKLNCNRWILEFVIVIKIIVLFFVNVSFLINVLLGMLKVVSLLFFFVCISMSWFLFLIVGCEMVMCCFCLLMVGDK